MPNTGSGLGGSNLLVVHVARPLAQHDAVGRPRIVKGLEAGDLVADQQAVDADLDPRQLPAFLGRDERVGHALAAHAAGAAHAVHVVVAERRDVEVDDVRDAGDVDAAAHDVGGHQPADPALAKGLHHAVAGRLLQVAVDRVDVLRNAAPAACRSCRSRASCGRR